MKLLTPTAKFVAYLQTKLPLATSRVYIQTMSFEGDSAGKLLVDLLIKSPAKDKVLIIDSYSKFVINDTFVFSPKGLLNNKIRTESSETKRLIGLLKSHGVKVIYTNPLGILGCKYPFRNHKKLVVCDNSICLGGVNFTDHNFEWDDFMIEIDQPEFVNFFSSDFQKTQQHINQTAHYKSRVGECLSWNGYKSQKMDYLIHDLFSTAKHNITIISPYISGPILDHIASLKNRLSITIYSPLNTNKPLLQHYIKHYAHKNGLTLNLYSGHMNHMKAIILDDTTLIFGSSNFDFVSYYCEQEFICAIDDSSLMDAFTTEVMTPLKHKVLPSSNRSIRSYLGHCVIKTVIALFDFLFSRTRQK